MPHPSGAREPAGGPGGAPLGAYVHIPFCAARCDYCAFATWTDRHHLIDAYVDALVADIERTCGPGAVPITSVFFGGGTPSLLPARSLVRVLDALPTAPGAEVTVECNPDSVDAGKLAAYRAGGVSRLSFGVQSMVPHVLTALGRTHTPGNVERAVAEARAAGFDAINVDVIYGAAGERREDWAATVDAVLALEPTHVSAYGLTVEAGTALATDVGRHPDADDQADKYELVDRLLTSAGFEWYEISNWARPGERCRHNLLYWSQGEYLAFGCAAHGHGDGMRWWNVRTPERYIEAVGAGRSPVAGSERLDPAARRIEALQLQLRTIHGVDVRSLALDDPDLAGLVTVTGDRAVLTTAGRLLANEVALRLR